MHHRYLLPVALPSLCAMGSPISRRDVAVTFSGPAYPAAAVYNATCNGTDFYNQYLGSGSWADGWPDTTQWASWDYLWNANIALMVDSCVNIGAAGQANNSPDETAAVGQAIQAVANASNVDPRFILAIMMQESKGCVRVQTTSRGNANPGLMQSHAGPNSCFGINPCPASTINGMIQDGVSGTPSGNGLSAIMDDLQAGNATNQLSSNADVSETELYFRAARMYNSGSIDPSGDLGLGVATHCYASDIANRLMGWVLAESACTLDGLVYVPPTSMAPSNTQPTCNNSCVTAKPGGTCLIVAGELGVSLLGFLVANPAVNADCTNLLAGTLYCVPVGSSNGTSVSGSQPTSSSTVIPITPPTSIGPSLPATPPTSSSTIVPVTPLASTNTILPIPPPTSISTSPPTTPSTSDPAPQPTGNSTCITAKQGDTCNIVAGELSVSLLAFLAANPSINSNCTNLLAGTQYCVPPTPPSSTILPASTNTIVPVPLASSAGTSTSLPATPPTSTNPVQPTGSNCDMTKAGDTCISVATELDVPLSAFMSTNPAIDANCSNLPAGTVYCVSIPQHKNATIPVAQSSSSLDFTDLPTSRPMSIPPPSIGSSVPALPPATCSTTGLSAPTGTA